MTTDNKPEIKKWVFIAGAPRSGTSLLQAIMNQHSECVSPPESHILETFVYAPKLKTIQHFKDKEKLTAQLKSDRWINRLGIKPERIVSLLAPGAGMMDIFTLYMQQYAAGFNKHILVEGSPVNLWFLKKLKDDFPGCFILHIVRDPRDVVLSTMRADYNVNFIFPPFRIAKQYMTGYNNAETFAPAYGDHYLKIYYEELVTNPEKVIKDICNTVKIDYEPGMLEFNQNSEKVYSSEETWKQNLARPFLSNNFGKWKTEMKVNELIEVEQACKSFFIKEEKYYQLSNIRNKAGAWTYYSSLANFYIEELKEFIHTMLKGQQTMESLEKLPILFRLKADRMLEK